MDRIAARLVAFVEGYNLHRVFAQRFHFSEYFGDVYKGVPAIWIPFTHWGLPQVLPMHFQT